MAGFRKKMHEMFDFDVSENNSNEAVVENQAGEAEDSKEITKEEVLKLVSLYAKKDPSIKKNIAKLIDLPVKTSENIVFDFEALALQNKTLLRTTIIELIDKDKGVQKIIDELATKPAPVEQPKPATPTEETKPAPLPNFISMLPSIRYDAEQRAQEIVYEMREHPQMAKIIEEADTKPRTSPGYAFRFKHLEGLKPGSNPKPIPASIEEFNRITSETYHGDSELACDEKVGCFMKVNFIVDRNGKVTDEIFPEEPKKGSK